MVILHKSTSDSRNITVGANTVQIQTIGKKNNKIQTLKLSVFIFAEILLSWAKRYQPKALTDNEVNRSKAA